MNNNEYLRRNPENENKRFFLSIANWILPICCVLFGLFLSSQYFAKLMNYDPVVIGNPMYTFNDGIDIFGLTIIKNKTKIYNPLLFIGSFIKYAFNDAYAIYLTASLKPLYFGLAGSFLFIILFAILRVAKSKNLYLYGTARWGNEKDLQRFGLLQKNGVILGQIKSAQVRAKMNPEKQSIELHIIKEARLICHGGKLNTLAIAPTGSGKGLTFVIPTLLSFRGSMICFDPKGENYLITAWYRSQFSHVLKFSPLSRTTLRFNPVLEIRSNDYAFRDANLIADIIFTPNSIKDVDETSNFFNSTAKDLLTTCLLHVRFSPEFENKTLYGILQLLSRAANKEALRYDHDAHEKNEEIDFTKELFEQIKNTSHDGESYIHDLIVEGAGRIIQMNEKVRADVIQTLFSKIQIFADPLLAAATSASDFELDDFINSEKPITLYLTLPFSDIDRIAPLFRLLITFILRKFSDGETAFGHIRLKNHILFMLDEFSSLGAFPFLVQCMSILRGYGMSFFIIVQALNQLITLYGQNHPFFDHCKTVAVFAPGKTEDAEVFCKAIGKTSVLRENISTSGNRYQMSLNNINVSDHEVGVNLMNPDQLMQLPPDEVMIMNHGMSPYIGKKIPYYEFSKFKHLANIKENVHEPPRTQRELLCEAAGLPSNKKRRKMKQESIIHKTKKDIPTDTKTNQIIPTRSSVMLTEKEMEILQQSMYDDMETDEMMREASNGRNAY